MLYQWFLSLNVQYEKFRSQQLCLVLPDRLYEDFSCIIISGYWLVGSSIEVIDFHVIGQAVDLFGSGWAVGFASLKRWVKRKERKKDLVLQISLWGNPSGKSTKVV